MIGDVLCNIANFCGKAVDIKQIQTTPPSKIFDELKRAEKYDIQGHPKYKAAAILLRELLISRINGLLDSIARFLENDKNGSDSKIGRQVSVIITQVYDSHKEISDSNLSRKQGTKPSSRERSEDILDLKDCEDLLSSVEMFAPHLPADLIEIYQPRLNELKSKVDSAKRAHTIKIENAINSNADDCHDSVALFCKYMKKEDHYHMKETADALNKLLKNVAVKVSNDLKVGKLKLAVTTLLPWFTDWSHYIKRLHQWRSKPTSAKFVKRVSRACGNSIEIEVDTISPQHTFNQIMFEIKCDVNCTLQIMLDRNNVPIDDLENHLDGLIILLAKDAEDILSTLSFMDKFMQRNLNRSIISIGSLFSERGVKVSKLLANINCTLKDSADLSSVADDVKNQLLDASEQIAIARKFASIFKKIYALTKSPSILDSEALQTLQAMDLSSVSYEAMNSMINKTIENLLIIAKSNLYGSELLMTPNASDRNAFYRKMQFALTLLIYWDSYQATALCCVNTRTNEESVKSKIMNGIQNFGVKADRLVESTDYTQLGILYDNLRSIHENFIEKDVKDCAMYGMKTIDNLFFEKIEIMKRRGWLSEDRWCAQAFELNSYEDIAKEVISMKLAATQMAIHKKKIETEFIDQLLNDYERRPNGGAGSSFFLDLSIYLSNIRTSDAPIAAQILSDHAAFYGHKLLIRNKKVLNLTVDGILEKVTVDDKDGNLYKPLGNQAKDRLLETSKVFEEDYWALVGAGVECGKDLETELSAIVDKAKCVAVRSDLPQNEKILKLMALIFAYWTLHGSKHYQETIASQGNTLSADDQAKLVKKRGSLLQPHAGQIVGILRMLGVDEEIDFETFNWTVANGEFCKISFYLFLNYLFYFHKSKCYRNSQLLITSMIFPINHERNRRKMRSKDPKESLHQIGSSQSCC